MDVDDEGPDAEDEGGLLKWKRRKWRRAKSARSRGGVEARA